MLRHRRIFLAATLIDALGSGLWVPFALLFLVHGQGMGLLDAGTSLSTGALLALVTGPATGAAMDRFGPRALLIAGNLVRVGAFCAYPLVHTSWQVIAVSVVAGFGDRLFWTCNAPMVTRLTAGSATDRMLATQTVGRFAGAGVGAAAMAVLPTITSQAAFHALAYLNAASFAVAAVLIGLLPREEVAAAPGGGQVHTVDAAAGEARAGGDPADEKARSADQAWAGRNPTEKPRAAADLTSGQVHTAAEQADQAATAALPPTAAGVPQAPPGSWRAVLTNRPFTGFCLTHTAFTLASASKFAVLPIVVRDLLHGPQWIAGTAITLGTVVVVTAQRPIVSLLAGRSRTAGLLGAATLFAVSFALLIPLEIVPLTVAAALILVASLGFSVAEAMFGPTGTAAAAAAAPAGSEGRASSIFQLSWGLPVALAPGLLAVLLSVSNALTWSVLALTCTVAVPALLVLRKKLPEALREPSPAVAG